MPNLLELFGESPKEEGSFQQDLFYLLREIPIYPFDVEFTVTPIYEERKFWIFKWKKIVKYKIIKNGMSLALFRSLMAQLSEHNKRQNEEIEKASK